MGIVFLSKSSTIYPKIKKNRHWHNNNNWSHRSDFVIVNVMEYPNIMATPTRHNVNWYGKDFPWDLIGSTSSSACCVGEHNMYMRKHTRRAQRPRARVLIHSSGLGTVLTHHQICRLWALSLSYCLFQSVSYRDIVLMFEGRWAASRTTFSRESRATLTTTDVIASRIFYLN